MIYFNFNIRNPWWPDRFANLLCRSGNTPWKHKHWEVEVIKNDNLLRVEAEYTIRQDHSGINLELGLLGYELHLKLYDSRHWDYEKGKWYTYE